MMITRAALAAVLTLTTFAATLIAAAQGPQTKVWRLAVLGSGSPSREIIAPLVDGLRALGYVEGQNITIEYRWADGKFERLPDLAADLVRLKVDLIVALATQASVAAKNATRTIPVVIAGVSDPVGAGVVSSLARPGGNVTGTSNMAAAVAGKQLELLKEALPKVSNVAVLWNPANPVFQEVQLRETKLAGRKLGIRLHIMGARAADELDRAFPAMTKDRVEALHLLVDPLFGSNAHRIAELIAKYRLPTVGGSRHYVEAGAFMTYGPNYADGYRHAATYVECFHEKALARQGQRGGLRLASVIPPIRQASIRTLRESLDPTRCMLGFGQFGRCNLPAIFADAPSGSPTLIKHSNAVARTGRSGMDRSFAHAEVPTCAHGATASFRSGS